jgi:hypothetical protein
MRTARLLIVLAILALSVGCTPAGTSAVQPTATQVQTASPTSIPEFALPRNTPNPECVPPCFYGIIPGQTTLTETLALLGASALQVNPEGNLRWQTIDPPRPWRPESRPAYNFIWFANGIVSSIQLVEPEKINLGEIVSRYGEPAAMAIGKPGSVNLLDFILIYPDKGLAFIGRKEPVTDDESREFTPLPDILVVDRIYFPLMPSSKLTKEVIESWAASVLIDLYPWPGFGKSVHQ